MTHSPALRAPIAPARLLALSARGQRLAALTLAPEGLGDRAADQRGERLGTGAAIDDGHAGNLRTPGREPK